MKPSVAPRTLLAALCLLATSCSSTPKPQETIWQLTRTSTNEVRWQGTIARSATATPGEEFVGVNRMRVATERAASACVRGGLEEISALDL